MNQHRGSSRCVVAILTVTAIGALFGPTASAAGTRFNESKYGFSFSLPSKWLQVPLNGGDIKSLLAKATKDDPSLENALSAEIKKAAAERIKFFAVGPIQGFVSPNLNIIVTSAGTTLSGKAYWQEADPQIKVELTEVGVKDLKTAIKKFTFGESLVAKYSIPTKEFGTSERGVQLYVRHKSQLDIVTVTSTTVKSVEGVATVLEDSWQWNKK
jgi:hypothetical protein